MIKLDYQENLKKIIVGEKLSYIEEDAFKDCLLLYWQDNVSPEYNYHNGERSMLRYYGYFQEDKEALYCIAKSYLKQEEIELAYQWMDMAAYMGHEEAQDWIDREPYNFIL